MSNNRILSKSVEWMWPMEQVFHSDSLSLIITLWGAPFLHNKNRNSSQSHFKMARIFEVLRFVFH